MGDLEYAKELFLAGDAAFVLVKDGRELARGTRDGIGELLGIVDRAGAELRGASLADRIVGKAVAMVAIHAGFAGVYTPLGSEPARLVLAEYGVAFEADELVRLIQNKRGDGPCPMERLTEPIADPAAAFAALGEFAAKLPVTASRH
jgi:hypothetical protein